MWKVEIVSREVIKPSSPTPHCHRRFNLSWLDQLAPRQYVPLILFYDARSNDDGRLHNAKTSHLLKKSLSEALTRYYPLAGRIKEEGVVDCNDEGVDFFEAKINGKLPEFLKQLDLKVLDQFVPCYTYSAKSGREVLFAAQANIFDCGGMAIGIVIAHEIADGTSMATFINSWAAMARRTNEVVGPSFDSARLFPSTASVPRFVFSSGNNQFVNRFVFDAAKIDMLKSVATKDSHSERPTSVEALSALIWRCLIRSQKEFSASVLVEAVSLRKRMNPPLTDQSFGNLWVAVFASSRLTNECDEEDLKHCLLGKVKEAIKKVDEEFIKELRGPGGILKARGPLHATDEDSSECIGFYIVSSWYRFPLYEVDFGWGKPIWIGLPKIVAENCFILMPKKNDGGMEVWAYMEDEKMAKFKQDEELLSFVSSPIVA